MKLDKIINALIIIFVGVILLHIPNNIFDWHIKEQIRTVQISIAITIFILYFINMYIEKREQSH
ncbi:hypothetical protein [Macrococcoides caseolyticum]|uniref:hypothetical protein n=1 Tax=Macrococcoides caseolyticum TaxID=69966 RepID=UPI000C3234F8|nr:hypothetical protein [Macrococcus caseolyticus]RAK47624.1 hypothetical protein C7R57_03635 [Macrococcus caseolyticus subsp. caseolyticus]PKE12822.1 hypothetical protein CW685_02085 [Macrococcus caseolyticus]PKE47299.1 hypothetical protein CW677_08975 [Macrococcus caseolyticus]PKF14066.1 hypothetical protein CW690_08970 [Macrococcus caseolyticus]PNZ72115.1 hypothetical protein CD152_08480 [Macrococcus caseolyticus]